MWHKNVWKIFIMGPMDQQRCTKVFKFCKKHTPFSIATTVCWYGFHITHNVTDIATPTLSNYISYTVLNNSKNIIKYDYLPQNNNGDTWLRVHKALREVCFPYDIKINIQHETTSRQQQVFRSKTTLSDVTLYCQTKIYFV